MIRVTSLTKNYGTLRALDHLDLHVDDGEIVGFVGANGAGKSTTMRIIMGSLISDEGEVLWIKDGQQVPMDAYHRRLVGYMPEERGLYPKMKVADQLTYLARLHGLSRHEATSAANGWMERLAVEQRAGDEVQKLSLGNQQRVQLAAALVSDPELLVLDEPFSGLDPVAVDVMSEVLRERAQAGVGTLFSSHQLDVVERLCDRVVLSAPGSWWPTAPWPSSRPAPGCAGRPPSRRPPGCPPGPWRAWRTRARSPTRTAGSPSAPGAPRSSRSWRRSAPWAPSTSSAPSATP